MKCIECGKKVEIVVRNNQEHYLCPDEHLNNRMIDHGSVVSYNDGGEIIHKSVGVIIKNKGQTLLLKRRKYPYKYTLPAGHLEEKDHNPREAALREVSEETGLTIRDEKLEKLFEGKIEDKCRRGADNHYWQLFRAEVSNTAVEVNDEAELCKWFDEDTIKDLELTKPTKKFLIEQGFFSS